MLLLLLLLQFSNGTKPLVSSVRRVPSGWNREPFARTRESSTVNVGPGILPSLFHIYFNPRYSFLKSLTNYVEIECGPQKLQILLQLYSTRFQIVTQ